MFTVEWSQVQKNLLRWRTVHVICCGVFIPFLRRHFAAFSSGRWQAIHWVSHCHYLFFPWLYLGRHIVTPSPGILRITSKPWMCIAGPTVLMLFPKSHGNSSWRWTGTQCSSCVCWVLNLTSLNFNVQSCLLWAWPHKKQAEHLWIIHAPVASQFRWNSTSFARVENRL